MSRYEKIAVLFLSLGLSGCVTVEAQQEYRNQSAGSGLSVSERRMEPRPESGWWEEPDPAFDRARNSGQPVFFLFYSQNSPPCQALWREVLESGIVQRKLEQAEPVAVDVDQDPELAGLYRIEQLPTFVVVAPDGQEYDRFSGFLPEGAFLEALDAALDPALSIPNLLAEIEQHPENLEAHWLLAQKYARDRNRDGLDQVLAKMREQDPGNKDGYLDNVAYMELMTTLDPRQPNDGIRAAERFLEEFPESEFRGEMIVTLAQLRYQVGDKLEAIDLLEDFVRRNPDSPLARQVKADLREMKR